MRKVLCTVISILKILTPFLVLVPMIAWSAGASFWTVFILMGTYLLIALQRIAGELTLLRKRAQIDTFQIEGDRVSVNLGSSHVTTGTFNVTGTTGKLNGNDSLKKD